MLCAVGRATGRETRGLATLEKVDQPIDLFSERFEVFRWDQRFILLVPARHRANVANIHEHAVLQVRNHLHVPMLLVLARPAGDFILRVVERVGFCLFVIMYICIFYQKKTIPMIHDMIKREKT